MVATAPFISGVAIDPQNPNILFASLWETRRTPWTLSSGGSGSGIYRSNDGGSTWKHLDEHGLPKGPYGRIGLAAATQHVEVLFKLTRLELVFTVRRTVLEAIDAIEP